MTWRNILALAIALALLALVWWLNWTANSRERAIIRAETAEQQADLNQGATQTVEHVLRTETIVRATAEEAADAIVSSTGADAPLSDDLLSSWRAGIDGVREQTASSADPRS